MLVFAVQELNQRALGEVIIRDALRELDMWGAGAVFQLTEYEDSHKAKVMLIKEWKELVTQVSFVYFCTGVTFVCLKKSNECTLGKFSPHFLWKVKVEEQQASHGVVRQMVSEVQLALPQDQVDI